MMDAAAENMSNLEVFMGDPLSEKRGPDLRCGSLRLRAIPADPSPHSIQPSRPNRRNWPRLTAHEVIAGLL
jgi:hypothetical protein